MFLYLEEREREFPHQYLVGKAVGAGSYGVVWKGFNRTSLKPVALKFIKKASFNNCQIADLSNEVKILKQLDHPCVTGLKEAVDDANNYIIVMEFAEGGELEHQVLLDKSLEKLSETTAKIQVSHYGCQRSVGL